MLPTTVDRVSDNTSHIVNMRLRREMEDRVRELAAAGSGAIARRLQELDEEWDVERTLEANAATLTVMGSALTLLVDRRFAVLPLAVGAFLLQHAIQGW